jgi:hypothetical protein
MRIQYLQVDSYSWKNHAIEWKHAKGYQKNSSQM